MGDRCYMEIHCRRQDAARFDDLGFVNQDEDAGPPDQTIHMVDEQANYAHYDTMPTDVPWLGSSGMGGSYNSTVWACDGKELHCHDVGEAGGFVIDWNYQTNHPAKDHVKRIRRYLKLKQKVQQLLGRSPTQ